ncbi:MAG: HAMP domain-containing histidine kinase [Solirubrobacterales bacterium]|nr:HAMP domain-containing histidine kinase [Solirubrobacterales bacterium]
MGSGEGKPNDDAGLLRRSLDGTPAAGVITFDRQGTVLQASGPAIKKAPSLLPGVDLREELEKLTHVEMVDRLLIRREVATFAGRPDGPETHWMVWSDNTEYGESVMTLWDTDWNEIMNERRAAFTMAASHELRGPLTTLQGFAEILNMDTGNMRPEQAEAAAIIESTARHLAILVEDVFDLSRNSFGELRLNLCDIDLARVVDEVCSITRPGVEGRGQSLDAEIDGELPRLQADEARANQMITNLINNASVHNAEGVSIKIRAFVEDGYVAVEVEDDGKGLPFDDPEEAFRTFRRGEESTAGDRTGSGIGLSITKRLIQLHRGRIEVESTRGAGTSFTLWFPIDRDSALDPGEPGPA